MLVLPSEWLRRWEGRDVFEALFALDGQVYRSMKSRKTLRFTMNNMSCFIKMHSGTGWKEIISNLIRFRKPVLGAENEWQAIKRFEDVGIDTMRLLGYGKRGKNPARTQSFVITEELKPVQSLEDYCRNWKSDPPDPKLKRGLITKVAQITRTLHENGMNHRDLYLCHFLLDIGEGEDTLGSENRKIYLIDLHRVQFRKKISVRWRLKDIAALCFSSMDMGLTKQDLLRFISVYCNANWQDEIRKNSLFWKLTNRRAKALYKKYQRHLDRQGRQQRCG
jgi:heptose I phosphotransferase